MPITANNIVLDAVKKHDQYYRYPKETSASSVPRVDGKALFLAVVVMVTCHGVGREN